jgi:hypothetical protein
MASRPILTKHNHPRENQDTFFSSIGKNAYKMFIHVMKGYGIIGPMKAQGGALR